VEGRETRQRLAREPVQARLPYYRRVAGRGYRSGADEEDLEPIWKTKTKTAVDVRSRIELVLNWAKIHGYRDGENPARWKGHLENVLPKPSKIAKVKHHTAMPYTRCRPSWPSCVRKLS